MQLASNILRIRSVIAIALTLALIGCGLIGGFNARALEHLTALKANYSKVMDTFSSEDRAKTSDGYSFTPQELSLLNSQTDAIDTSFRQALEYSKSLGDELRTKNIEILKELTVADFAQIKKLNRYFNPAQKDSYTSQTFSGFDRAIKGECVRIDSTCK